MDVTALRWFQQVADGATVTEVSELEFTSQPGISRALARLADEVGAPLLRRDGRLLRLTHAGAAFKRHVDAMLHHLDDGLAAVAQLMDPETGVVTVAFQPSLGSWLVPALAAGFRAEHPDVQLDLRAAPSRTAEVDLELTTERPSSNTHAWRGLVREPIRLVVPDRHPLATAPGPVPLARLGGESFVAMTAGSQLRRLTDSLLANLGVEPEVAFVVDDLPSLYGYVAAGLGVSLAPPRLVAGAQLRPLTEEAFRDIGLAWARDRRLLPSAELFRDHALRQAKARRLPTPDVAHDLN
ncbi:MAG: LysR substrate-binding domain-containing protein [Propionibacteriaceae bacterium]|nr:LysR substrate-binding domain-containing protein [Propionibacteriaceae bacterium]